MVRFPSSSDPWTKCVMGPHAQAGCGASTSKKAAPIAQIIAMNRTAPTHPAQARLSELLDHVRASIEYQQSTGLDAIPRQPAGRNDQTAVPAAPPRLLSIDAAAPGASAP